MKIDFITVLTALIALCLLESCGTPKYMANYAPEESGLNLMKITDEIKYIGFDNKNFNIRNYEVRIGGTNWIPELPDEETLRTFVFVVDFSEQQNSDFGLFLKEQSDENIRARILTEFIIVDYQRGVYFKVGGGRIQDRDLRNVLDKTSFAVKMTPDKRKEWTAMKKTAIKRTLEDIRPKKENASVLVPAIILVFINVLIFIADIIFMVKTGEKPLEEIGIQYNKLVWEGQWWRLLTSVFLHGDLSHIAGNMVMLILISRILSNFYSNLQYWIIYLTTGIIGSVMTLLCMGEDLMSLGASGAVMGLGGVLCFRMFFGSNSRYFRKAANCITIGAIVAYNLVIGLTMPEINNWAHFSGFIAGFIMAWIFHLIQRNKQKNNNKISA